MIQVISKFLILTLTLLTFGVNPTVAEDIKDKKIQQLETLLETYIEENRELKQRLNKLGSENNGEYIAEKREITSKCNSNTSSCTDKELCQAATYAEFYNSNNLHWRLGPNKKFVNEAKRRKLSCGVKDANSNNSSPVNQADFSKACKTNLKKCDPVKLCEIATYKVNGAKKWKVGSYEKFVDEAKRRNITCEVDGGIKSARSLCEENLTACDATSLCEMSTHVSRYYENGKLIDNRAWFKTPKHRKLIDEAKRRNLSCGVIDLKVKAERDRQEAEKEEARLATEAEKKRKAEEKERLSAEAEVKRKEAEEKARLAAEAESKSRREREALEQGKKWVTVDMTEFLDSLFYGSYHTGKSHAEYIFEMEDNPNVKLINAFINTIDTSQSADFYIGIGQNEDKIACFNYTRETKRPLIKIKRKIYNTTVYGTYVGMKNFLHLKNCRIAGID